MNPLFLNEVATSPPAKARPAASGLRWRPRLRRFWQKLKQYGRMLVDFSIDIDLKGLLHLSEAAPRTAFA